jgi:IclR family transcriptional regulator, acetate operon repressor
VSSVQSIDRAFAVLDALAGGPLGVTEVATRTGLPKSTAARLLTTLVGLDAVEQVPGGTDYRLGPRSRALSTGIGSVRSLVDLARPSLVELAAAVGEAVGLSVPEGSVVHYIDQVDSPHPVAVRDWTGTRLPMHPVSSGRVFLAAMAPAELDRILAEPLERFTLATVTDPGELRAILRNVVRDGISWTADEYAEGITSVAAPVPDASGEVVVALHVHGPSYRFPNGQPQARIEAALRDAASRLAIRLRTPTR